MGDEGAPLLITRIRVAETLRCSVQDTKKLSRQDWDEAVMYINEKALADERHQKILDREADNDRLRKMAEEYGESR